MMNRLLLHRKNESEAIKELENMDTKISGTFARNLPKAKKRVLHQLIQAIVRENFFPVSWNEESGGQQAALLVPDGGQLTIAVKNRYLLGHLEIGEQVLYQKEGNTREIEHPADVAQLLKLEQKENSFIEELENSVVNYALALTGAELRREKLGWQGDAFSFLLTEMEKDPCFSPLVFGEQWVIEGHTLHPCSKTKLGITINEVIKYSPEWEGSAKLIPVAIQRDHTFMQTMGEKTMTQILLSEYPCLATEFKKRLPTAGKDYELIPVHPWQLEHTIKPYLKKEISQAIIIPLESIHISASALLSFRSLAPIGSRTLHHIKTAVNVQMTSAKRTVSPTSVKNGPTISTILKKIVADEPVIRHSSKFLAESAGGHYVPEKALDNEFLMKNLSALIRENPEKDLTEGEIALPAAFLISQSPFTGKLILLELVEHYSEIEQIALPEAAEQYMRAYAELLLPGLLTMITKYGISLEAHLQNTVPVFHDGMPVRFLFRDNGGIRIKEDRFALFEWGGIIDNDTNLLTNDEQDLFNMFSHALLHNHLGEMIFFLAKEMQIKEEILWQPVKDVVDATISVLKEKESCRQAAELLEKNLSAPLAPLKALVKMRLADQFTENVYTMAPNPLKDAKRGVESSGA